MKFFYVFISISIALVIEWAFGQFFLISPPVSIFVALVWFFSFKPPARFFLATVLGIFLDTISVFPFGTYLLTLLFCALACDTLIFIFSDTTPFSPQRGILEGTLLFIFFLFIPVGIYVSSLLVASPFEWTIASTVRLVIGGSIWSLLLPSFDISIRRFIVSTISRSRAMGIY